RTAYPSRFSFRGHTGPSRESLIEPRLTRNGSSLRAITLRGRGMQIRGLELPALIALSMIVLSACSRESAHTVSATPPTAPPDHYAPSAMTFGAPHAVVSSERHTGAFAAGDALSPTAAVKPLDPSPVKEIHLDTTHKVIELAPGVKFA